MLHLTRSAWAFLLAAAVLAGPARAGSLTDSLKKGTPDLQSAGALAFGPEGILFVGDAKGAAVFAIATEDNQAGAGPIRVKDLGNKIAGLLGTTARDVRINDLAVNPASGKAYVSVSRGQGAKALPVILRIDPKGNIQELQLKDVKFAKALLPNAPAPEARNRWGSLRQFSITKVAYVNGRVFVSGLSNEEWASKLRSIPFPFTDADRGTSVQIYHGSHGRFETDAPIRTFVPFEIQGEPNILAAYTCTPLVKIPVKQLKPGARVKGTTLAELGNHNSPLDMIVYEKDGKTFLLIANSARGLMKVTTDGITKVKPITARISNTAGLKYETIKDIKGVQQLDRLDKNNALVLLRTDEGVLNLETIPLP